MKKTVFALALSFIVLSCGNTEDNSETMQSERAASKDVYINSPCELISAEEVKSICNVESQFEIIQEDKLYIHPTCTFKWKDKKVSRVMTIGGSDMTIEIPSKVLIVMVHNSTEEMFEQSTSIYKDGNDVSVGENAIWGTNMSQLTFLSKGYLFHVNLNVSNDDSDNKQKAIKVAELLMGKI